MRPLVVTRGGETEVYILQISSVFANIIYILYTNRHLLKHATVFEVLIGTVLL